MYLFATTTFLRFCKSFFFHNVKLEVNKLLEIFSSLCVWSLYLNMAEL